MTDAALRLRNRISFSRARGLGRLPVRLPIMRKNLAFLVFTAAMALLQSPTLRAALPAVGELIFQDDFNGKLGEGWTFEREERAMWRVGPAGLEVRVQPGGMWGGGNNAKNVMIHPIPAPADAPIEIAVTISNNPTAQWEQANLVWYYDAGNMVKLGQELVTGRYSIVMGREENDRARTVAIIPLDANTVELRLQAVHNRVRGQFRTAPWSNWRDVGECDLPVKGEPKASLHFYNGPANEDHWVRVNHFTVRRLPPASVDWPRVRVAENYVRAAGVAPEIGLATLKLPGDFVLCNQVEALKAAPKAEFEQRVFVHQDGSYGWYWDRRASASKEPMACGVALGDGTGAMPAAMKTYGGRRAPLLLESEVVTRLEGDQGNHNLAAVVSLASPAPGRPSDQLVIWFDWYGKASEVQTLNDGHRDYGLVQTSENPRRLQYRIKGFRGAPPIVNLQAFLEDAAKRGLDAPVTGIWFGNEVWNGSRGGTLVTKLDLVIDGKRHSSIPPKPTK